MLLAESVGTRALDTVEPSIWKKTGILYGGPATFSCLENPMVRGAWKATVHAVAESDTTEQLTLLTFV